MISHKIIREKKIYDRVRVSCIQFHTYHNSSAFWVNSQELSRDNAPAAALPKCLLVDLFKHVFGWLVFQDDNATTVTPHYNVVYK